MRDRPLPPLRPLEAFPAEHHGETVIVLRDPEGISDGALTLPLPAYFIVSCFDGSATPAVIQATLQSQFGLRIRTQDIESLARQMDEHFLLQTEKYAARRRQVENEYAALPARPAIHAGQAYPASPEALKAVFEAFFALEGGAGPLDGLSGHRRVAGLILPHMDPRCSGACASWALKALSEAQKPELFLIFGTAHQPLPGLFSVSDKDFETPLGVVPCDKQFVAQLRQTFGAERLTGELVHKNEHSIEFQVVYLHALYGAPPAFQIVPILCGSFQKMISAGRSPAENPELVEFCGAVRRMAQASGKRVCCVAAADLAHVGHKFGDEQGLSDELIDSVRRRDLEMLGHVERLDREAFFRNLQAEGDERKVCGLPPMYAMMSCIDPREGKLLRYDYNIDPQTQSLVSFCSMAFYA